MSGSDLSLPADAVDRSGVGRADEFAVPELAGRRSLQHPYSDARPGRWWWSTALSSTFQTSARVIIGEEWPVRQRLRIDVEHANPSQKVGQFMGVLRTILPAAPWRRVPYRLSLRDFFQRCPLVHRDVIGLVALDLILRGIVARVTSMPLVVNVLRVHANDRPADVSGFRVPSDVIANLESFGHDGSRSGAISSYAA
jgi:hypothetical protein